MTAVTNVKTKVEILRGETRAGRVLGAAQRLLFEGIGGKNPQKSVVIIRGEVRDLLVTN